MKRLVKRQLCKFRRTNNREYREKYVNDRREYERLLMKKETEFDEERLTQLKQNFNNPSMFYGRQFGQSIESLQFIIPSRVNSGTNTSLSF